MRNTMTNRSLLMAIAYWKSKEESCLEQTVFSYDGSFPLGIIIKADLQRPDQSAAESSLPNWISLTKNLGQQKILPLEKDDLPLDQPPSSGPMQMSVEHEALVLS